MFNSEESILTVPSPIYSTFDPRCFNTSIIISTSLSPGTPSRIISSVPNTQAASIGNAEFFAPEIVTSPSKGPPPFITKTSFLLILNPLFCTKKSISSIS